MQFLPCSSLTPICMGTPLQIISTSCSLCTADPSFVKIDTVPSSAVLSMLMTDVGKSPKESACSALFESCLNENCLNALPDWNHHWPLQNVCWTCIIWEGLQLFCLSCRCSVHWHLSHRNHGQLLIGMEQSDYLLLAKCTHF